jgi:hypothetical protein
MKVLVLQLYILLLPSSSLLQTGLCALFLLVQQPLWFDSFLRPHELLTQPNLFLSTRYPLRLPLMPKRPPDSPTRRIRTPSKAAHTCGCHLLHRGMTTVTSADLCDTPVHESRKTQPLEPTQLTNNGQTMPTRLIHVSQFPPPVCTHALIFVNEISSPHPRFCTHADPNDYVIVDV